MRRIFLMSSVLFVAPFVFGEMGEASAQCVATTDCASLGYTETSCPNGGIKCPFGNTWSCKREKENVSDDPKDIQCYNNCCIGYIYHSDGSCSKMPNTAKVPLGVVVLLEGMDKLLLQPIPEVLTTRIVKFHLYQPILCGKMLLKITTVVKTQMLLSL